MTWYVKCDEFERFNGQSRVGEVVLVPKDDPHVVVVRFLDGFKKSCDITYLEVISREEYFKEKVKYPC